LSTATGYASRHNADKGGNARDGQNGGSSPPSQNKHHSADNADVGNTGTMEVDEVKLSSAEASIHNTNPNPKSATDLEPDESGEEMKPIASNIQDTGKPDTVRKDKGKQKLKSTSILYRVAL